MDYGFDARNRIQSWTTNNGTPKPVDADVRTRLHFLERGERASGTEFGIVGDEGTVSYKAGIRGLLRLYTRAA